MLHMNFRTLRGLSIQHGSTAFAANRHTMSGFTSGILSIRSRAVEFERLPNSGNRITYASLRCRGECLCDAATSGAMRQCWHTHVMSLGHVMGFFSNRPALLIHESHVQMAVWVRLSNVVCKTAMLPAAVFAYDFDKSEAALCSEDGQQKPKSNMLVQSFTHDRQQ